MSYFKELHSNADSSCISCGTQQLSFENYKGCLCSIISDVEAASEERIIENLAQHSPHNYYVGKNFCKGCELLPMELICGCCHQHVNIEAIIKGDK